MSIVLVVVLVLLLVGGLPGWGWHSYGYAPSGVVTVLLVLALLWAFGVIRLRG